MRNSEALPSSPAPVRPRSSRRAPGSAAVPRFALYGETASPGQEMLHIEEVWSRSSLYHWEIEAHLHQGLYQILWVRQGQVSVLLDESHESVVGPAAIVIPPGVVHGFRFEPGTDGLVLTLSARFLVEGEFQAVGEAFRALFAGPAVVRFEAGEAPMQRLDALLRELAAEFMLPGNANSPVPLWLARALVWRLAQACDRLRQAGGAAAHRHQAQFTRFLLLVEQHFLEHWSIEQYASRLGLSTPRLNRLARAESGRSALELVHERLTREACRRLVYIAAPVASVAEELGFVDPAYFSRFFKRRIGMNPHRWRQAQLGGLGDAAAPT